MEDAMVSTSHRRAAGDKGYASADLSRASLYEEVTRRVIADLESGRVPWVQPWGDAGTAPGLPRNAATGRSYSGVNILLLWAAMIEGAYSSQCWLTFRQALGLGGSVRKGERGTTIVYADRFTPHQDGGAEQAARADCEEDAGRARWFLKRFTVFNVAQCDGLPLDPSPDPVPASQDDIVEQAEALIDATGVDFRIGGQKAFYSPGADFIAVPPQEVFIHPINYYRTALHELTHWTGHGSRLARDQSGAFGSDAYAREELTAEMGAAFLCATLGIVPTVRHADYIACWLDVLRGDNRAIFRAASAASKAADYLLAFRPDPEAAAAALETGRIAA
jgi:antirestriction protein ArdC